ncbi:MAG: dihydrodipicolinate synthase family protein [Boseongicola sp. SB0670_bin_30]|nr:dihydrodipicolinate synthase family protein [Boseongicola sp. SB0670_bin_30]
MGTNIAQFGISAALLTPFHPDGSLNVPLFCEHANTMLQYGASGVTPFGTTGEGASIAFSERSVAIAAMIDSGVPNERITLGLCGSAIGDVVSQVEQGCSFGITDFLLLPPFYFKDLDDTGLFDWHARLFEAVDPRAKFVLYHIPQVTHVPLSLGLVRRLCTNFPGRILAIKDSAGSWDNTSTLLASGEVPVLVGDERLLHRAAAMGCAGSICGMANLYPQRMRALFDTRVEDAELSSDVDLIVSVPVIPALKQAMAARTGIASWSNVRAPLQALRGDSRAAIAARFLRRATT